MTLIFIFVALLSSPRLLLPEINPQDAYKILTDGRIALPNVRMGSTQPLKPLVLDLNPQEYCVEEIVSKHDLSQRLGVIVCRVDGLEDMTSAILTFEEEEGEEGACAGKFQVYPAFVAVSAVSLFLTSAVYLWIADLRSTLPGKTLISLCSSLFVANVILMVEHLDTGISSEMCIVIGLTFCCGFLLII